MRRPHVQRPGWPLLAIALGAVMIVSAIVVGLSSINAIGKGDLDTAAFGETIEFVPTGAYRASIYVSRDLADPPACAVTTSAGDVVTLRDATPYTVNTRHDMEAAFGFHLEESATYRVRCGRPGQPGAFAVVEISPTAQRVAIAVGVAGAVVLAAGVAGALLSRRRRLLRSAA